MKFPAANPHAANRADDTKRRRPCASGALVTGSLLAGVTSWAVAAEPEPFPSEMQFTTAIPMVVSATRLSQPVHDAPAAITVIDREMIEASGALEIADLLRFVPGFQVAHAAGNRQSVGHHGLVDAWPRRMQVLVDGRSVYVPLINRVDWTNIGVALADVERIEVIRGPNAVAYGANAFTAAINIITRPAFAVQGTTLSTTVGENDTHNALVRHAGAEGAFEYRVTAEYRADDGFDYENDHKQARMVSLHASYAPSFRDAVDVQAGYSGGEFGGWGDPNDVSDPFREQDIDSQYGLVRWQRNAPGNQAYQLQFYYNHYTTDDAYVFGPLSDYLTEMTGAPFPPEAVPLYFGGHPDGDVETALYDGTAERYDLEFEHTFLPHAGWRMVWGAGLRLDRAQSEILLGRPDTVSDNSQRLFFNAEWLPRQDVTLNGGIILENHEVGGSYTSSRVGINYHFSPGQTLRASASHSGRAPSLYETYLNRQASFVDDPTVLAILTDSAYDLEAERIRSYEIGYIGDFPRAGLTLDIKVYREELDHLIEGALDNTYSQPFELLDDLDVYVYDNGSYADIEGFEVMLSFRPTPADRLHLQYSRAWLRGEQLYRLHPDSYRDWSDAVPLHTASALLSHRFTRSWEASLAHYFMSELTWLGDGNDLPGYHRSDLRIAKRFGNGGQAGQVEYIVQNLFDEYQEFRDENFFETRHYVRLTLNL